MTGPPTLFETAIARASEREAGRNPATSPPGRHRNDGLACPPAALEVLALLPLGPRGVCWKTDYEIEKETLERKVASRGPTATIHHLENGVNEVASVRLDTQFHSLRTELTSGQLPDPSDVRMRYIAYVKSFHPDLVPPAQQKLACQRLAELHRLLATTAWGMRR